MANVVVNDESLLAIGNAIREKNGTETKYKPAEMAQAIQAIEVGGGLDLSSLNKAIYRPGSSKSSTDLTGIVPSIESIKLMVWVFDSIGTNNMKIGIYLPDVFGDKLLISGNSGGYVGFICGDLFNSNNNDWKSSSIIKSYQLEFTDLSFKVKYSSASGDSYYSNYSSYSGADMTIYYKEA